MKFGGTLRRHWPEALLVVAVALPWVTLLVFGMLWLWQTGRIWMWAIVAAVLGLLAWPLLRLVRRRANAKARLALGDLSEPSRAWTAGERDAWSEVLAIASKTDPFWFTEVEPLAETGRQTIEAVSRRFHPNDPTAWAKFTLPELLLLTERVSRDLRREALRSMPGARDLTLSRVLWFKQQYERYGPVMQALWRWGYGAWRLVRIPLNPIAAAGQEFSRVFSDKTIDAISYRLRAMATQEFVLAVGRAAIDLYSGRLTLSDEDLQAARAEELAATAGPVGPVRLVLIGQVSAGKSSLVNALAQESWSAVGPLPTTARVVEYRLESVGRPAVSLVDMPGVDNSTEEEFLEQVERADLVVWVASATQPARDTDLKALAAVRAWAATQLTRRVPPIVLALTHVDELRPASEWQPPYDIAAPVGPKAHSIRAASDSVAKVLGLSAAAIVPVAMPPDCEPYNIDALWAAIALELDEARLVQLDRLRVGRQGLSLRELAQQLGRAGRFVAQGMVRPYLRGDDKGDRPTS
jgi:predicted GTPase